MADVYSLDDYKYAQHLRLYNDENRENVGFNDIWTADDHHYWDTRGCNLGLHTIDVTQPSTEPRIVCSFKNGLTYRLSWDSFNLNYSDDQYSAYLTLNIYDKNGDIVPGMGYGQTVVWDKQYNRPATSEFLYSSPSLHYQLGSSDHPTGYSSGGAIITVDHRPIGSIIRDMPDIRNSMTQMDGIDGGGQWYGAFYYDMGYDSFEEFMASLGKDPSPKKPDDDTSKPDESDPDYDPDPDPVPFPDLPDEGDALSTGFITVYRPTTGQLQSLALKLWSSDFIETFRKAYNDPIEAIVSLHSIPFQIVTGSNEVCKIGNYDTNISMLRVSAQYYTLNCGTIRLNENWGSALDYAPYTQVEIYLPFVGVRPLNIDDIMNKNLEVKYNIDILTGGGIAMIKCDNSVLYTYPCEVSQDIPYTMSSKMQLYTNVAQLVVSGVTAMAAPSPGTIGSAASSAINVASGKQTGITRGGTLGGNIGVLGDFTPYLIVHKPIQSLAADFAHKKGYPSNMTADLSSLSGYTEIESIHLTNIPCTDSERDEIERLLKEGVIL